MICHFTSSTPREWWCQHGQRVWQPISILLRHQQQVVSHKVWRLPWKHALHGSSCPFPVKRPTTIIKIIRWNLNTFRATTTKKKKKVPSHSCNNTALNLHENTQKQTWKVMFRVQASHGISRTAAHLGDCASVGSERVQMSVSIDRCCLLKHFRSGYAASLMLEFVCNKVSQGGQRGVCLSAPAVPAISYLKGKKREFGE